MLSKEQKREIVKQMTERIQKSDSILLADFTGLNVSDSNNLRKILRNSGIEMKVVKKTLIQRAMISSGILDFNVFQFPSSVALIFSPEEGPIASKEIHNFAKKNESLKILGGIVNNVFVDSDKIVSLAKIPSREILLSQLLSVFNSLPKALVGVLGGNLQKFVFALNQISKTKS
jgi:large subunit ribosomal protein L10